MKLFCLPPKTSTNEPTSSKRVANPSDSCIPSVSTPICVDSGISTGDATPLSVCRVLKFDTAQDKVLQPYSIYALHRPCKQRGGACVYISVSGSASHASCGSCRQGGEGVRL